MRTASRRVVPCPLERAGNEEGEGNSHGLIGACCCCCCCSPNVDATNQTLAAAATTTTTTTTEAIIIVPKDKRPMISTIHIHVTCTHARTVNNMPKTKFGTNKGNLTPKKSDSFIFKYWKTTYKTAPFLPYCALLLLFSIKNLNGYGIANYCTCCCLFKTVGSFVRSFVHTRHERHRRTRWLRRTNKQKMRWRWRH